MSRLPTPGGDSGDWGSILNDYLSQAHAADGTLKDNAVTANVIAPNSVTNAAIATNAVNATSIADGSITSALLDTPTKTAITKANSSVQSVNTKTPTSGNVTLNMADINDVQGGSGATNNQVLAFNSGASKWIPSTVSSTTVSDATNGSKGIVQLAGDLAGTASSPTVPGLAGKEPTLAAGSTGQYWRGDKSWQTLDKTALGLANVDNTSDANKLVSTAQQTALNKKVSVVTYAGDLGAARPTADAVYWVDFPSTPTNAQSQDIVAGSAGMSASTYDPANIAQQVVGTTATQIVTNKTLDDSTTRFSDTADATKLVELDVNSSQATGTTKVITLPSVTATLATLAVTETHLNKRVVPRVSTVTSAAAPTFNTDTCDVFRITAQAADITSMTTNMSGTPTDGQPLRVSITGTATRAITWGASFEASSVPLPTTTNGTARLDVDFVWNTVTSKWRMAEEIVSVSADIVADGTMNKAYTAAEKTKLAAITGTNTGDQTSVSGNAGTATQLATPRNINGVAFDGTANITVADVTKEPAIIAGSSAQYWRGDKTMQTLNQDAVPDGTTNKAYTATEKTKLAGLALARNIVIPATVRPGTTTGTYSPTVYQAATLGNMQSAGFGTAINAYEEWEVALDAGTYVVDFWWVRGTANGIVSLSVDGGADNATTVDTYGTFLANQLTSFTAIALTAGLHAFRFKRASKNASSTGYGMAFHQFAISRTGA
jgi:hypothetical protein